MEQEILQMPLRDFAALTRYLLWTYDGPPPVSAGPWRRELEDVALWLVQAGRARIFWPGGERFVDPGQWVLPPTPSVLGQEFAADTRLLSLRFGARWSNSSPLLAFDRPIVFASADHPSLERQVHQLIHVTGRMAPGDATRMREAVRPLDVALQIDAAFEAVVATLLPILLTHDVAPRGPGEGVDPRVESAVALLDTPTATPRSVAKKLGLSISQLDRLFVAAIGVTPHALQQRRRLEYVRRQLRQTDDPIKAIAYAARFRRVSHFSAWFSKSTGLSPRAYRRAGDELA